MKDVYASATIGVAYIGEKGEHTETGVKFIKEFTRRLLRTEKNGKENDSKRMRGSHIPKSAVHATYSPPRSRWLKSCHRLLRFWHVEVMFKSLPYDVIQDVARGLFDLINRPFFERQWIIQEVTLGKDVHALCGDLDLLWATLLGAAKFVQDMVEFRPTLLHEYPRQVFREKTQLIDNCEYLVDIRDDDKSKDLWTFLQRTHQHRATEQRDKIYSLLGIANDSESAPLPNYDPSTTVQQVFRDYARYFCRCGKAIELINRVCSRGVYVPREGYPSWAPWFSDMVSSDYPLDVKIACASGDSEVRITLAEESDTLVCKGAIIDQVLLLGPEGHPLTDESNYNEQHYYKWVRASAQLLQDPDGYFDSQNSSSDTPHHLPDLGDAIDVLFPMFQRGGIDEAGTKLKFDGGLVSAWFDVQVCFGHLPKGMSRQFLDHFYLAVRENPLKWKLLLAGATIDALHELDDDTLAKMPKNVDDLKTYHLVIRAANTGLGNHIFVTEKALVGVGLNEIRQSDVVAILSGGSMPYILRRVREESEPVYKLIGWAYIAGYMNGEALEEPGFEFTDITIQ